MKINWNKIKLSPVAIQFLCWVALLFADVLINVVRSHGLIWGVAVIVFGLVGFFLPNENKEKFGYVFSALLICLPIGGILKTKKALDDTNYLENKSRLESQKETFDDSLYTTSDTKEKCEFTGKHANYYKLQCQAGNLAIEAKNSKLTSKAIAEKERVRVKNEGLDSEINKLPRSISWGEFFADPKIFRGLVGSFLIPLLILAAFPRGKEKSIELPKPESFQVVPQEKQMSRDEIKSLVASMLGTHKITAIARITGLHRSRVNRIKDEILSEKCPIGQTGQNRTEQDADRTIAGQAPDIYRAKGERWGHEGQVSIKVWNTRNQGD